MKKKNIGTLKPAVYNPRKISNKQAEMLKKSMLEFGDLSGIVYNVRSGNLIGGHQRCQQFDPAWEINKEKYSDNMGTVAEGYIQTPFGRWRYREVDWDIKKEKAANVAANKQGGDWDLSQLRELIDEINIDDFDLDIVGLDDTDMQELFKGFEKQTASLRDGDTARPQNLFPQEEGWRDKKDKMIIKNDCERGILVSIGFCDSLILPESEGFKEIFEIFGKAYKYPDSLKKKIIATIVEASKKWAA